MWAIEASPGPKVAIREGGIILLPAILLRYTTLYIAANCCVWNYTPAEIYSSRTA